MTRWADVIVGDYNYYFDTSAMLFALAEANRWRVSVLVDEAHNLVDRARGMYTATLDRASFNIMRRTAPPFIKSALTREAKTWSATIREQDAQGIEYKAHAEPPESLLSALGNAVAQMTEALGEQPDVFTPDTLRFYFDAVHSRASRSVSARIPSSMSRCRKPAHAISNPCLRRASPARTASRFFLRRSRPRISMPIRSACPRRACASTWNRRSLPNNSMCARLRMYRRVIRTARSPSSASRT